MSARPKRHKCKHCGLSWGPLRVLSSEEELKDDGQWHSINLMQCTGECYPENARRKFEEQGLPWQLPTNP